MRVSCLLAVLVLASWTLAQEVILTPPKILCKTLFEPAKEDGLTDGEKAAMKFIREAPTTAEAALVQVYPECVVEGDKVPLQLRLPRGEKVMMEGCRIQDRKDYKSLYWAGGAEDTATITFHGKSVTGTMSIKGETYRLVPIGENLQVLIRLAPAKGKVPQKPPKISGGGNVL